MIYLKFQGIYDQLTAVISRHFDVDVNNVIQQIKDLNRQRLATSIAGNDKPAFVRQPHANNIILLKILSANRLFLQSKQKQQAL